METVSYPDNPDISVGLGTGQPESRSAAFGASILASHPGSLAESQARYNSHVSRHFVQAGVQQITQNARSALSAGLAPGDPRTGTFQGRRWVMTSPNARSASTTEASPLFQEYR
jgi:hypothetical protein